ncbi:sulfatase family protein [Rhodopirellula bahusiensis]|nr:arylsulfatase [Rhodopirellula bahusiensis]|tara:strand:- start:712873 stop:714357 length:1485 start_codon:yes stop_codon:yes gene_type:complete
MISLAASLLVIGSVCAKDRPNVVVLLMDDLGYGDLSCYGATKVKTPNVDQLAAAGRRFTDAHSPASVCTPSRYNLLTGRYAWRTWNGSSTLWANDPLLIDPDRFTIADLFQTQGYSTACIGKWHLGFGDRNQPGWDDILGPDYNLPLKPGPNDVGFEYFWGFPHVGQFPHIIIENDRVLNLDPNHPLKITPDKRAGFEKDYLRRPRSGLAAALGQSGPDEMFYKHKDLSDMLTDRAVRWIEEYESDQPFFLYVAHRNIHAPIIPAKRFRETSEIGPRGDFIAEMDWSVGQVVDALQRKQVLENTLLLLTSDNGGVVRYQPIEYAADHGHLINGPLRGQKTTVYEGGHRIPFIARWPKMIKAGSTSDEMIALTDMLATFSDYFEFELPDDAGEDSFSVLTALLDVPSSRPRRNVLVNDSFSSLFSIRQGPWKLILGQDGGGAGELPHLDAEQPAVQLYHLGRDIAEKDNLSKLHPDRVAQLTALLEQIRRTGRSH